jgi:hypothetical protein
MSVRRSGVVLGGAALLGLSTPATAAADGGGALRRFLPTGQWVMDYAEDSCRLSRTFAEGGKEVTLTLERFEPDAATSIALTGGAIKTRLGVTEARIMFAPVSPLMSYPIYKAELADGQPYYHLAASPLPRFRHSMREVTAREAALRPDMPADAIEAARSERVDSFPR